MPVMQDAVRKIISALKRNEPATSESLAGLSNLPNIKIPQDFLDFLKISNGAAGTIGEDHHIILWAADRLIGLNQSYEVDVYAPGLFLFGSNGGGEAYAFDKRSSMAVIQVPFVGMALTEVEYLAPSFSDFLILLQGSN